MIKTVVFILMLFPVKHGPIIMPNSYEQLKHCEFAGKQAIVSSKENIISGFRKKDLIASYACVYGEIRE